MRSHSTCGVGCPIAEHRNRNGWPSTTINGPVTPKSFERHIRCIQSKIKNSSMRNSLVALKWMKFNKRRLIASFTVIHTQIEFINLIFNIVSAILWLKVKTNSIIYAIIEFTRKLISFIKWFIPILLWRMLDTAVECHIRIECTTVKRRQIQRLPVNSEQNCKCQNVRIESYICMGMIPSFTLHTLSN